MGRRALSLAILAIFAIFAILAGHGAAAAETGCPEAAPSAVPPAPDLTSDCVRTAPTPTSPGGRSLVPDLAVLKSPEAPAFAALDIAPTAISRPGTPTGAAVTLAAGVTNGVLNPGENVAIDIAPYWLIAHPGLSAAAVERDWWRADRRLSISLASTTAKIPLPDATGMPVDTDVGRVAIGAHTSLYPGRPSAAARACARVVDEYMRTDVVAVAAAKTAFVDAWIAEHPRPQPVRVPAPPAGSPPAELDAWQKKMEALNGDFVVALARWSQEQDAAVAAWRKEQAGKPGPEVLACLDVIHHRTGPMLDVAFAEVLSFPGNDIRRLDDAGRRDAILWATGGYTLSWGPNRPGAKRAYDLSLLALLKHDWQHIANAPGPNRLQVGARAVFAFERWGFSAEGLMNRTSVMDTSTTGYRVSATADYHLKTGLWLTLTGGADLDADGKPTQPIGLAAFNANFGRDRVLAPDSSVSQPAPVPAAGEAKP
jgi:hypothetical protein